MSDLSRFITAQQNDYEIALSEIQSGRKQSHWMWYIFPQLKGLGMTSTADYYGIDGMAEAKEYLSDDYLRNNSLQMKIWVCKLQSEIILSINEPIFI